MSEENIAWHKQPAHEMANLSADLVGIGSTRGYLDELSSIQEGIEKIRRNVANIATLHARSLSAIDGGSAYDSAQLDQLSADTRALSNDLKDRIRALQIGESGPDSQIRKNRLALVRSKFIEVIQYYQRVEHDHRVKSRQRVERQLKIIKPDATQEDIAAAVDSGEQQIFAQVLSQSSRYAESRITFREVQERQQELKKLEETLAELAQLMTDMGTLIEQQEDTINTIGVAVEQVEKDTKKAEKHLWKAVLSARNYRKGRWICFGIIVIIIIVVAAPVAWKIVSDSNKK